MGLESIKVTGNTLKRVLNDGKVIFSESRINYSGARETLTVFYDPVQRKIVDGTFKVIKKDAVTGMLRTWRQDVFGLTGYGTESSAHYRPSAEYVQNKVYRIADIPGYEYYPLANCQFFRDNPDLYNAVEKMKNDTRYQEAKDAIFKAYDDLVQLKKRYG